MGVFWHNAAETWIDISNAAANRVLDDVIIIPLIANTILKVDYFYRTSSASYCPTSRQTMRSHRQTHTGCPRAAS